MSWNTLIDAARARCSTSLRCVVNSASRRTRIDTRRYRCVTPAGATINIRNDEAHRRTFPAHCGASVRIARRVFFPSLGHRTNSMDDRFVGTSFGECRTPRSRAPGHAMMTRPCRTASNYPRAAVDGADPSLSPAECLPIATTRTDATGRAGPIGQRPPHPLVSGASISRCAQLLRG